MTDGIANGCQGSTCTGARCEWVGVCAADGDVDAVFLTQTSVEWLENVGGPLLFSPVSHVISNAVTNLAFFMMDSLNLIDYNRDGRMDVCVGSQADRVGRLSVFTNMGPAHEFVFSSEEVVVSATAFNVNASAVFDVDLVGVRRLV